MQSQTTFASLGKGEDGEWEVRVLKQKIWVDGVSYELQVRLVNRDINLETIKTHLPFLPPP